MTRRAFTLVELLITSVIFVVIAGYAVTILTTSITLHARATRSSAAALQGRQVLDKINEAFIHSTAPAAIVTTSELEGKGTMLFFTTIIPGPKGEETAVTEQHAYCAQITNTTKHRLVRFIFTGGTLNVNANNVACNSTGVQAVYTGATNISAAEYLTNDTTDVLKFSAQPLQYAELSASPSSPTSLRLLLTTAYDAALLSGETDAVQAPIQQPLTIRTTVTRIFPGQAPASTIFHPYNGQ